MRTLIGYQPIHTTKSRNPMSYRSCSCSTVCGSVWHHPKLWREIVLQDEYVFQTAIPCWYYIQNIHLHHFVPTLTMNWGGEQPIGKMDWAYTMSSEDALKVPLSVLPHTWCNPSYRDSTWVTHLNTPHVHHRARHVSNWADSVTLSEALLRIRLCHTGCIMGSSKIGVKRPCPTILAQTDHADDTKMLKILAGHGSNFPSVPITR